MFRLAKKIASSIKSLFLSGLFTLLPITATIFFATSTYNLILRWLSPLKQFEPDFLYHIPASEFILVGLFIVVIGILIKFLIIKPLIHYFEKLIDKIPLIRTVYSASKTMVDFFNVPENESSEKKVVLIEYPRKECFVMAFMLDTSKESFQNLVPRNRRSNEDLVKVFMPSSPAPTTGYFLLIPRKDIILTDISFEEAVKAIVSCGLVTPESLKHKNK